MASVSWCIREHALWGASVNRRMGTLLLGIRRAELRNGVCMDVAVLEEMLKEFTHETVSLEAEHG